MFNKQKYLEKLFEFTEVTAKKEVIDICTKIGFNPDHYSICIPTGGLSYTLERIAHNIYLSRMPICDTIRQKLFLFNIVVETAPECTNILRLNEYIKNEKKGSWSQDKEIKRKEKTVKEILKKVDLAYQKEQKE